MKINPFIKRIYSKGTIKRTTKKITALGVSSNININEYLLTKLIILVLTFFIVFFTSNYSYYLAPLATVLVYLLIDYVYLDLKISKRTKTLEKDAIFYFEVLALTLQSEKNLKLCLENTSDSIDSDLSSEFKEVLKEVKVGKSLTEALTDAKERIPSKSVNNILLNIIESYEYGTSINDALENQIEYLTEKRVLSIKEQINKMPTKISIISVVFFIPLILLLIIGPIALNYFIK